MIRKTNYAMHTLTLDNLTLKTVCLPSTLVDARELPLSLRAAIIAITAALVRMFVLA